MIQKKYLVILLLILLAIGCVYKPAKYDNRQLTGVDLTNANYHVIKSNAVGTDRGFNILGVQFVSTSVIEAMSDLREQAPMEGKATALANLLQEESISWWLLFSIPKITVSADIIEFDKTPDKQ